MSAQRKPFPERSGLTLLTGAPPPQSGGGEAVEVYRIDTRRTTTASGAYRINNTAIRTVHARRQYELQRGSKGSLSPLTIVSFGLIVVSVGLAILTVIML